MYAYNKNVDTIKLLLYNNIVQAIQNGGIKMGNEIFSKKIKTLRMERGLSLDQLAAVLGVNKSRAGMWESNGTVPRDDVLIAISKYFDVSIDFLLGNDEMEGKIPDNSKLQYLQRNLGKLDSANLEKAQTVLKAVFDDIFEDDEEDDDGV